MTKHIPNSSVHIGINGFGRIGRIFFRASLEYDQLHVTAINDPHLDVNYITYLIKYDSSHGKFNGSIRTFEKGLLVNEKKIKIFSVKMPQDIPWHLAAVDYVVDASGVFTSLKHASLHLQGTPKIVKRVLVAASSVDLPTIIRGVNHKEFSYDMKAVSCASTTLCTLAPLVKVLDDHFGVVEGMVTVLQSLAPGLKAGDGLNSKGMIGGSHYIIPGLSGSCRALGRVLPHLENKLAGIAYRVPNTDVSLLDLTIKLRKETTISEIKDKIHEASNTNMKHIIRASDKKYISSDMKGDKHSCVVDFNSSLQLNPTFFKFICWYDNEYAYGCRIAELIVHIHHKVDFLIPIRSLSILSAICAVTLNKISKWIDNNSQIKKSILTSNSILDDPINYLKEYINKSEKKKLLNDSQTQTQTSVNQFQNGSNVPIMRSKDTIQENQYHVTCNECYILPRAKTFINRLSGHSKKKNADPEMESYILWQTVNSTSEEKNEFEKPTRSGNGKFGKKNDDNSNSRWNKDRNHSKYKLTHSILSDLLNVQDCDTRALTMINSEIKVDHDRNDSKSYGENIDNTVTSLKETNEIDKEMNLVYKSMHEINTTDEDIDKPVENEQGADMLPKKEYNTPSEDEEYIYFVGEPKRSDLELKHNTSVLELSHLNSTEFMKVAKQNIALQKPRDSELNKPQQKNERNFSNIQSMVDTAEKAGSKVSPLTFDYINAFSSLRRNVNNLSLSDKLESMSGSDSGCSVNFFNKKSFEINLCDIADSMEDLDKLDQICRIIEISDELTDQLFANYDNKKCDIGETNWSVKRFCERVQFDDFFKNLTEK